MASTELNPVRPMRWLIIAAFLIIYLVWGSSYIAIQIAIESMPPFLMAGSRFTLAGLLLISWSVLRGSPLPTRGNWRAALIAGGVLFLGNGGLLVWSQRQGLPSGIVAVLLASVPMWMVLLQWLILRGKRPNGRLTAGMLLGLIGIFLLISRDRMQGDVNPLVGLVTVGAALMWAAGSLYARRADLPKLPLLSTGMQLFCGGLLLIGLSVISGDAATFDPATVKVESIVAVAYLMIFASIIGFTAYTWLIRVVPPEQAATYAFVNPIVAVVLGALLASESLSGQALIGAGVTVAAVFLITTEKMQWRPIRLGRHRITEPLKIRSETPLLPDS